MSEKERQRRLRYCVFVGSKVEIPNALHAELRRGHGGADPEHELQDWYCELNEAAEVGMWRVPQDNEIFKWVKDHYAQKFPPSPVNGAKSITDEIDEWARS